MAMAVKKKALPLYLRYFHKSQDKSTREVQETE
jgi:hypothetical protein